MLSGPGGNVVVLFGTRGQVRRRLVRAAGLAAAEGDARRARRLADQDADRHALALRSRRQQRQFPRGRRRASSPTRTPRKRLTETHDLLGHALRAGAAPTRCRPTPSPIAGRVNANGDQIILAHVPPAHTDTDILVHFSKGNVLHMGDLFFNGMYPFIDASTRGTINGMISAADRALQMANDRTKIVPGHGPLGDRAALQKYRTMLATIRDRVRAQKDERRDARAGAGGEADRRVRRRVGQGHDGSPTTSWRWCSRESDRDSRPATRGAGALVAATGNAREACVSQEARRIRRKKFWFLLSS